MKKIILSIIFFVILALVPILVFASEGDVAQVGIEKFTVLEDALNAAMVSGKEVILLQDAELSGTFPIRDKNLTINLSGFNISGKNKLFEVTNAEFTVKGKGMLAENNPDYAPIRVYGSSDLNAKDYTVVNIGSEVTLKGWAGIMIVHPTGVPHASGVVINCNGTIFSEKDSAGAPGAGIYINGTIQNTKNYPVINLSSTTIIDANSGVGLYAAGFAKWNINGSTIKGTGAGIGTKAGIFNINNATIIATGEAQIGTSNGNGINPTGAGIQIESNDAYAKSLVMNINNTSIESKQGVAFYEYLAAETVTKTAINELTINNVILKSGNTQGKDFEVSNAFTEEGFAFEKINGNYSAGMKYAVKLPITENGEVKADNLSAIAGKTISLEVKPAEGYKLKFLRVIDVNGNTIALTDYKFKMPDADVTVEVEFEEVKTELPEENEKVEEDITEKPIVEEKDNTPKTGSINISTYLWFALASIALIGIITTKKSRKHSK